MIPKVIHYCWFGGKPIPKEYMKYIDSWKSICPITKSKDGMRATLTFTAINLWKLLITPENMHL